MNCFMSYNPNVAHEVKVTTWIKEFDGASPVYPSFPNEGDVFIVFDNDEATEPSVNKTYTNGDWADTSSGGGGGGDYKVFKVTVIPEDEGDSFGLDIYTNDYSCYDGMFALPTGFGNSILPVSESTVYDLICYGDSVNYVYPNNTTTATSGAIEYDSENSCYIISGDCSVTGWLND